MAIDPRIALGVEPVRFSNNALESLRDVMAVQESRQRIDASKQRMQAEQQQQREVMAVQQILQETGGDWHAALPKIRQVAPMASIEIEKQLGEMRTRTGEAAIKAFELEEKQEADTLSMFQFVRQKPELYAQMLPVFQERVKKIPKEMWPDPSAPDLEQQLDKLAQININVIDQAKANQENVRLLLKGDLKGLESGLAMVDDAAEWDAALLTADQLLQLPKGSTKQRYGDYSPEKVAAMQKGDTGGAFTLSPGSKRFDAKGNVIAEVEPNQGGSAGFSLSPGQVRYGPDGQVIASRPDRPATTTQRPLTQTAESQLITRYQREWATANKPNTELGRQIVMMEAGLNAARRGDLAQGNEAVLQTFLKVLDPNSVVREGEFWRLQQGQSLVNRARAAVQRIQGGGWVPLPELEKYAALAKEIQQGLTTSTAGARSRIGKSADRYSIPHDLIFDAPPEAAPAGGGTTLEYVRDPKTGRLVRKP